MKSWLRLLACLLSLIALPAIAQVIGGPVIAPGGTTISLTTSGSSGAATLTGNVLNIPVYSGSAAYLSALLGATTTNSIDNAAWAQTWTWNSLTTQNALTLSTSTETSGNLLNLSVTTSGASGNAGYFSMTGTGNTGAAGYFNNPIGSGYAVYASGAEIVTGVFTASGNASLAGTTTIATAQITAGNALLTTLTATTIDLAGAFSFTTTSATAPQNGIYVPTANDLAITSSGVTVFENNLTLSNLQAGNGALAAVTTATNSTAVGTNALNKETVVGQEVAVGSGALSASLQTVTTAGNVAVGYQALSATITGYGNTAVGWQAMESGTGGGANNSVAVGYNSMTHGTSPNSVAVGAFALDEYLNGAGTGQNVAVGYASMDGAIDNTSNSTAVGYETLQGVLNGAVSETAIGSEAGKNITGGSNTVTQLSPSSMRVTVTYRDFADQNAAEACGLSKAGAGQSPHNCVDANGNPAARAFDFAVLAPDGTYITRGTDARYAQCGQIAKAIGEAQGIPQIWGGDWTVATDGCEPDFDHVEMAAWKSA